MLNNAGIVQACQGVDWIPQLACYVHMHSLMHGLCIARSGRVMDWADPVFPLIYLKTVM